MFQGLFDHVRKFVTPTPRPQHIRVFETAGTIEDCLRKLERSCGLPKGDLSIVPGDPREVCTFPAMRKGLSYQISSKLSEQWREEGRGYIAGSIFETEGPSDLTNAQLARMDMLVAAAISIPHICVGNLHISKNCPGVYSDNVCITCGDRSTQ